MPLGIEPTLIIDPITEPFEAGDIFLAATDGVTDSEAFKDGAYDELKSILYDNSGMEARDIADTVYFKAVASNIENPFDDIVVVCIKRQER